MHKLLYSMSSPFSAKVRMAAAYAGIPIRSEAVDTSTDPAELLAVNPLGKIPTLVTEGGEAIFDSRAILQYLDLSAKGVIFPRNAAKRMEAQQLEALADGICDCLLAHVYERRFRPEDKIHLPWLERQWMKATRALDRLNQSPPKLTKRATAGQIALRATLGYLALRFPGQWERGRAKLVRWAKRFDERFPELVPLLPQ